MLSFSAHRIGMSNPADMSGLKSLIDDGTIDPATIIASIGKTEGNGGANDFTRALATLSASILIGSHLDQSPDEVAKRVAFVWSGGCEGVLSPHMTVFTRQVIPGETSSGPGSLAISVQRTRSILPEEVGRTVEVLEVANAVRRALDDLGCMASDVHYVQVKGPLLTPAGLADAAARGREVVTADPNLSKAYARGATALGVAIALGEVEEHDLREEVIAKDMNLYSSVASTSAGGELTDCEVLVFANSSRAVSTMRIGHATLADAVDIDGARAALRNAGLDFICEPDQAQRRRIRAVFAKAESPIRGLLRGQRTTMLSDADINYERHARAATGAVLTALTGDPRIFVSGGTEHQCPPGHAPIAAIVDI